MLIHGQILVCTLAALGLALRAETPAIPDEPWNQRLQDRAPELGLGPGTDFRVQDLVVDPSGARHVRLQQRYRGLRVWGGQAILHLDAQGREQPMTDALVRGIQLEVQPNLDPAEALALADTGEAPRGTYARPPNTELLVYPEAPLQRADLAADTDSTANAEAFAPRVTRFHLAYHIRLELENGPAETRHDDFLVDAHTGAVLKRWSTLFTAKPGGKPKGKPSDKPKGKPVETLGQSQYSGEVRLGSLAMACGFILSDPTRGNLSTRDLGGDTQGGGRLYVSPVPRWGDGLNYRPERGSRSENGQTAAVDAHFGLQTTWDFYKHILGRDGVDGKGTAVRNLVHYASGFDNAFWSDDCFCMTYGDGDTFNVVTALDVVAHEVSHGLCQSTAGLDYQGETGGLNEANSDIFGTMVQLYAQAGQAKGDQIPAQRARWTIGADLETKEFPRPLRYMYKPSLDGDSPDAWSPDLDDLDVHFSSGPMNRAFYFMCEGASPKPKDPTHSKYLPHGMRGIGNDKALRIWWRALSLYLTPRSRYLDARKGALRAARDLFGDGPELKAVRLAFTGINVGRRGGASRKLDAAPDATGDPTLDTDDAEDAPDAPNTPEDAPEAAA